MSNNQITTVTADNAQQVLDEINEAFWGIPFENSAFQTENFVIAASLTPERAYRAIGLRLHQKIAALQEYLFDREVDKINMEKDREMLHDPDLDSYEKRLLEIKIRRKEVRLPYLEKLANDTIEELNLLYKHFKALPKYTKEQFEAGERAHYLERLNRQALGVDGPLGSLAHMHDDIKALQKFEEQCAQLPANSPPQLLENIKNTSFTNLKDYSNIKGRQE